MYKWVRKVNTIVQSTRGMMNNDETRRKIAFKIIEVLNAAGVKAWVDCGVKYNTPEVVDHGEFRAMVDTEEIYMLFKCIRENTKGVV